MVTPTSDGRSTDTSNARDLAVVPSLGYEPQDFVDFVFGVHDRI
jgi:hypothetical protein